MGSKVRVWIDAVVGTNKSATKILHVASMTISKSMLSTHVVHPSALKILPLSHSLFTTNIFHMFGLAHKPFVPWVSPCLLAPLPLIMQKLHKLSFGQFPCIRHDVEDGF